jgi:biopolymer transport protein ExbD
MTEKRRFLDVWIVESNTVYREVPFTVVADWVQQGRLLEDDMLRPSGTADWFKVGESPSFSPYLPRAEPYRAEDQAEALEPVQVDFAWKRPHDEEDEDVDMIPLIDVSLVLLIFFMLTATGVGVAALIPTPEAESAGVTNNPETIVIGMNLTGEGDTVVYSLSEGTRPPEEGNRDLKTREELLQRLDDLLAKRSGHTEVTINAHKAVKSGLIRQLTVELEQPARRAKIIDKYTGVSDKLP